MCGLTDKLRRTLFVTIDTMSCHDNPDYVRQVLYAKVTEITQYATDEACLYIEMLVDEYCQQ